MAYPKEDAMAEFGQLFNFEQATTPGQAQKGKTMVSPQFTAPGPENAYIPPQPQSQTFQPPSHQYELFKQHTSLAPGAYSAQQARQLPSHSYQLGSSVPLFDIAEADGSSFGGMDMDFPDMFEANSASGFVDPSSVGPASEAGDASPVAQPVQRLWPGMHQQHAKEQQKKLEQQKLQQQQRKALQQQQQQLASQASDGHQRRSSQGRNKPSDPVVEERISQILRSMRQNIARPSNSATPQPVMNQPSRQKKDEEDMDEDERLLASEEGKKLSSKERRQLRNKVSARAFRSRRKEYITQLEGELQGKTSEADELHFENEALRTENSQLTELARMLLGHPAFSNVLEDLTARGAAAPMVTSGNVQQRGSIPQSNQSQITTSSAPQQSTSTPMDFSQPMDAWNANGISAAAEFNFNPNVYAVTDLPDPILDTTPLSGKPSGPLSAALPTLSSEVEKPDYPVLHRSPVKTNYPTVPAAGSAYHDDLFSDDVELRLTGAWGLSEVPQLGLLVHKHSHAGIELVSIEHAQQEEKVLAERFATLCDRLDSACLRLDAMIVRS